MHNAHVLDALRTPIATIPTSLLYDDIGTGLYEQIIALGEYYLLSAERAIIDENIDTIARSDPLTVVVVELGAGNGHRTLSLVQAIARATSSTSLYIPVDISGVALRANQKNFETHNHLPGLAIEPIEGTHDEIIGQVASRFPVPKTWIFMGTSLGNYSDATEILSPLAHHMIPGYRLLIGIDTEHSVRKPIAKIILAYDDPMGITAAFTLNALTHANRIVGLDFDIRFWKHVCLYDEAQCTIFLYAEAMREQTITVRDTGRLVRVFVAGERILVEQSRKYSYPRLSQLVQRSGLIVTRSWGTAEYLVAEVRRS